MKLKKLIMFIFLCSIILLTGCNSKIIDSSEKILCPTNNETPLSGQWEIESFKSLGEASDSSTYKPEEFIGKKIEFLNDTLILGTEICKNPKYKIKNVNSNDYFLYNYKISIQDLGITNDKISIISVTSNDTLFYDFIQVNSNTLLIKIDNSLFYVKKLSDKANKLSGTAFSSLKKKEDQSPTQNELLRSGILIGLKYFNSDYSKIDSYSENDNSYRTLWISSINKKLNSPLACKDLLVPRISGFWKLGVKREISEKSIKDSLFAFPSDGNAKFNLMEKAPKDINQSIIRDILFVGNDYVFTEYATFPDVKEISSSSANSSLYPLNKLQVLPMDNLTNNSGLKISDITGDIGKNALIESSTSYLSSQSKTEQETLEKKPNEKNFYMSRRNGHWILKGRLNNTNNKDFEDFNINLIPPKKIVNFDELYTSWNNVKSKVPDAVDVFTSPNKDIALIVSKSYIYIYTLNNNLLSDKPLSKIKIHEGESVIMAEWATGTYVERWEKAMLNNGGNYIEK